MPPGPQPYLPACLQAVGLPSLTLLATESLVKDDAVGWMAGRLTEAGTRSTSVGAAAIRLCLGLLLRLLHKSGVWGQASEYLFQGG